MVKKNKSGGIELTKEEAKKLIFFHDKGKMAHTFFNMSFGLLGGDHSRKSLYDDIDNAQMLQLAGDAAQTMGHALAIIKVIPCKQSDILFIETKQEEVDKINAQLKNSPSESANAESLIIAKSDKSSEDLPSPETAVSASPKGEFS